MNRSIVCLEKHVEEVWLHAHPCFSSFPVAHSWSHSHSCGSAGRVSFVSALELTFAK